MLNKDSSAQWISLSDMMTGLMLIFLLLSVVVISEVNKKEVLLEVKQNELERNIKELELKREEIKKYEELVKEKELNKNKILVEYKNVKKDISKDLKTAFESKEKEWEMQLDDNLVIKFNKEGLFLGDSSELTSTFKELLNKFIPNYLSIINNPIYNNKITEVRIEGHAGSCKYDEYMYCLKLSQARTNEVIKYIYNHIYFINLSDEDEVKVKFLITSNGMGNGRNIDKDGNYIFYSEKKIDPGLSRRVEFKIVTNSEALAETLLENINN